MLKNPAAWLAIGVLAVATIVMVFFVMPRISADRQPIGAAINEAGKQVEAAVAEGGKAAQALIEDTKPAEPAAKPTAEPVQQAAAPAAASAPASAPAAATAQAKTDTAQTAAKAPTFDVLRVEPDGSTVIAGRAEPGTKLEVSDNKTVLAKADVASGGEFAAILDNPLPPGDHELVLKATGKDGKTVISEEIATISVPKVKGGELLAMVTKPGEPSRLIATPVANDPQKASKTERVTPPTETAAASPAPAATANITPAAPAPAAPATPAAKTPVSSEKADIQITAVEIEGERIFVAGIAKPQTRLRGYADDAVIGDAQAAANGHFVIDGKVPLAIGDHRISVDHIGANGQALLRVTVPFNRPAGEQVAAVATPSATSPTLRPIDDGAFDKLRNQVARAQEILVALYASGGTPSAEQLAAARSATAIALKSLTQYRLPIEASEEARRIAQTTIEQASAALASLEALPRDATDFGKGLAVVNSMIASAIGPVVETPRQEAAAPGQVAAASSTDAARTIEQAPLTKSDAASVIIRRGDTLWQISRRVYGQGVRYTTIYLANEEQIANPDLIQPGQVFGVPDKALPDAEEIHRKRLKSRS